VPVDANDAIAQFVGRGVGVTKKVEANLMKRDQEQQDKKREYAFQKAPRCTAKSKRTGQRCKAPAVRGWTRKSRQTCLAASQGLDEPS
jgi:hypothetical protein